MTYPANFDPAAALAAHLLLKKAHAAGQVEFFTDPKIMARPDSPLYNPIDVFAPPLVLMASSLTVLFAFGLLEWIITLALVLVFQLYGARHLVNWRVHHRAIDAVLKNPHNLQILWQMGGFAIGPKGLPNQACVGPQGDWIGFCNQYFAEPIPADPDEQSWSENG